MTDDISQPPPTGREPTEAEVRAALEEELRRVTVDDVLLQTIVSLVNLGGRRAGLAPGTEGERDPEQLRLAIDAVRALMPLVEPRHGEGLAPVRDAVSQLQLAYAQLAQGGAPGATAEPAGEPAPEGEKPPAEAPGKDAGGAGPAQSSGRLWVPGD
jgi:hypothetical protein